MLKRTQTEKDFKDLTKLDALQSLQKELSKLLSTASQNEVEVILKNTSFRT
jgi:hypothetical protein